VIGGGALVGALALALALVLAAPVADVAARSVEWSTLPVVRGSALQAVTLARGGDRRGAGRRTDAAAGGGSRRSRRPWRGAGRGPRGAAAGGVIAAAVLEAAIAPLPGARLGIAVTSAGFGVLYVGAGRRLGASLAARATFELGALALQALMLIG
jgi:hypothetical protein